MQHYDRPPRESNLTKLGTLIGIVVALFALAGAWLILPYRVDEVEKKVRTHDTELTTMKEVLIRIDENVKELRRTDRDDRRPIRSSSLPAPASHPATSVD